jgi:outer membrane lipoprotein SlyB
MRAAISAKAGLAGLLLLAGCANPTRNTYESVDVGRTIAVADATVVSSRIVKISGDAKGYGPAAGGIAGASTGALAIGAGQGSALAGVLGGLLGIGAGYIAEQVGRDREGIEYVLQGTDGRVYTIVQNRGGDEQPFAPGTGVLVQYGASYARVIERPANLRGVAAGEPGTATVPHEVGASAARPAAAAPAAPGTLPVGYGTVKPISG